MAVYELQDDFGTKRHPYSGYLKIGHLNANGLLSKIDPKQRQGDDNIAASITKYDVFAVTETKLTEAQKENINQYTPTGYALAAVENRIEGIGGGVAIYVENSWEYEVIKQFSYNLSDTHEPIPDAGDSHPCQFIHLCIKGKGAPHECPIHIVAAYLPPEAKYPKCALLELLGNQLEDFSNVIVLGDMNLDQFSYELCDNFNLSVWEREFGQIITKFTHEKESSASNPRKGTILDHIYVKFTSMPGTELPLSFIEKCKKGKILKKHLEQCDRKMSDTISTADNLKNPGGKVASRYGDKFTTLERQHEELKNKFQALKDYLQLGKIQAARNIESMISESGVVRQLELSDHDLVYCVVRRSYMCIPDFTDSSPIPDVYSALIRSSGWNYAGAKQELRSIITQIIMRLTTSFPSQLPSSIHLSFDTDKINRNVLNPIVESNTQEWSVKLFETGKQIALFGRKIYFLDNRCPKLQLLCHAYMSNGVSDTNVDGDNANDDQVGGDDDVEGDNNNGGDSRGGGGDASTLSGDNVVGENSGGGGVDDTIDAEVEEVEEDIDPNWWIASPCSSFLVLPLHDHLVTRGAVVKDMLPQNTDREYHYQLRSLAVAAVNDKFDDLHVIHSYIRFVVSHYVQPKSCSVEYDGEYGVLHFEAERQSKVRMQMECLGDLIKEKIA